MTENCNECSIAWIRGGEYAEVSATNKDGSIFAHVPVKYVKLRAPRELTEEQRAELIERGKNMSRNKSTDCEETSDFDSGDDNEEMFDV